MARIEELREPWAITQAAFQSLREVEKQLAELGPDQVRALMARDSEPVDGTCGVDRRGDVAIMHVKGPLFRYHSWVTSYLGTSSYGELRKDLQRVIDMGAQALLVVFDSPGGQVNGLAELGDAFFAARSRIPAMEAYVSGTCASAAYLLAGAVGKIRIAPTALLGSVGVMGGVTDYSKMYADAGIKDYEIVNDKSPNKSQVPSDPAFRARLQAQINDLGDVVIGRVGMYRGIGADAVVSSYGAGDCMVGQRALAAGMADEISDVEAVIAGLQARATASQQRVLYPSTIGAKVNGTQDDRANAGPLGIDQREGDRDEGARAVGVPGRCVRGGGGEGHRRGHR